MTEQEKPLWGTHASKIGQLPPFENMERYWPLVEKHASPELLKELNDWRRIDAYAAYITEQEPRRRKGIADMRARTLEALREEIAEAKRATTITLTPEELKKLEKEAENGKEVETKCVHTPGQIGLDGWSSVGECDQFDQFLRGIDP